MEAASVCLSGETTITRDGMVKFMPNEKSDGRVIKSKTQRMGRMVFMTDGALMYTPAQMLKQMALAPTREKIHDNGNLRVEMTSRSFLVHVKMPINMEDGDIEDLLDDEIDNATEIIMKKKEEMGCSIL